MDDEVRKIICDYYFQQILEIQNKEIAQFKGFIEENKNFEISQK